MNEATFVRKLKSDSVYETRGLYELNVAIQFPAVIGDSEQILYTHYIVITTYHGYDGLRAWATPSDSNGDELEVYELAGSGPGATPSMLLNRMGYTLVGRLGEVGYSFNSPYWDGTKLTQKEIAENQSLINKYGLVLLWIDDGLYTYQLISFGENGKYDVCLEYTYSIGENSLRYKQGLDIKTALSTILLWYNGGECE